MKRGIVWATGFLVIVNLALLVAYLTRQRPAPASASAAMATSVVSGGSATAGQPGVYFVTGVVKELKANGSNLVIRHEAIPGFMPAMTMPFTARDSREIASVHAGEKVRFRLLVTDDESWIDSVERLGVTNEPALPFQYETARIVRDVEPLKIGDPMPDYPFTNELGAPVRLSDFRGQAIGLTFIFTRCPLPEFCPRMLKNFSIVHRALQEQAQRGGPTNWHLVAMSFDPLFDTPPVLKNYAQRYAYDPARWTFLTGAMIDIDAITEQVGMVFRRQTPTALPDHNVRTAVISPAGRLLRLTVGNTWKPEDLVRDLSDAAAGRPLREEAAAASP